MLDAKKVWYVAVLKKSGGTLHARAQFKDLFRDPDLIDGFVSAVAIFAQPPLRSFARPEYDILIEHGDTCTVYAIVDKGQEEQPIRKYLWQVLDFAEKLALDNIEPDTIRCLIDELRIGMPNWFNYHFLQCLVASLDMSWLGFLDGNPIEHLEYIVTRIDHLFGRDTILSYVSENIYRQIDSEKTTIQLDLGMAIENGEFAKRVEKVLAKRKREITEVEVVIEGQLVNLKNLWLTSYGFSVLKALDVGTSCNLGTFYTIEREFAKSDITIRTTTESPQDYLPDVSPLMRNYIWELADKRNSSSFLIDAKMVERFIKLTMK
ncbi:hypothetical protein EU528_14255 [Candidatus Thorarchaeota archaeon]|nr:MAG: hypothetical protein EU528_14255 [Candidatus Thorarchaeota archaeon]